jgi:hypothetical protein
MKPAEANENAKCKMQNANWGLGEGGMSFTGSDNLHFAFFNLHFAFPPSP